ncbi:DUF3153 domain-containing protein [Haloactinomyces albus]|uniref:LppM domain-containing protein n=1 Tax=Haloactinomyces albus TaxID=1352928 RepID=A0AAE3ZG28_9ACTN|nr:DUF3153 domain-containing protein [Haloactinomyces albus]MDR7303110.1 hypothetical protein [Haloactinomyces albus]
MREATRGIGGQRRGRLPGCGFRRAGHRRRMMVLLLGTLVAVLVSGCLNANVSLTISENDRVSGQVLVTVPTVAGQEPLRLRPPRGLAERVQVSPYEDKGRSGTKLSFTRLTFNEVERLGRTLSNAESRYRFDLSRTGSLVMVQGSVDLTPLARTDSSVLLEINTPGEITTTNGHASSGLVSWRPKPGEVTRISATFQFSNTSEGTVWLGWTTFVGAVAIGVALLVAVLALFSHRRMRREALEEIS